MKEEIEETLSQEQQEYLAQKVLAIGLNDMPDWVAESDTLADFVAALNEWGVDVDLARADLYKQELVSCWKDLTLEEAKTFLETFPG